MDTKVKKAGLMNTIIAFMGVLVAGGVVLAMVSGPATGSEVEATASGASAMAWLVTAFLLMGFLVAVFSFFHMHLIDREMIETLEHDALSRGSTDTSMFEADAFPARRTREQFDKWFVPAFTVALLLFQGITAYYIYSGTFASQWEARTEMAEATWALALSSVFGLMLFLRGRYATLLSRMGKEVILQPGSDFLLLGAYMFFAQSVAAAGAMLEYAHLHLYVAYGLCILLAILTLETLLRLILDIYRPRVEGREVRQLYHSRLVGLISKPESFFTTAAHTLDYQFGFKVSGTWGYEFMRKRLGSIVLLQLFVLWLSSSVVIIQPNEVGVVQRGGQPLRLDPGIRLKLPWPLESVERYHPEEILTLVIGPEQNPERTPETPHLWDVPNVLGYDKNISMRDDLYKTYYLTKPSEGVEGNATDPGKGHMLFGHVTVNYRISNVEQWSRASADPKRALAQIAEREVTRELLLRDANSILTVERGDAAGEILKNIKSTVKEHDLGIDVVGVGLAGLQPPPEPPTVQVISSQDRDKTKESGSEAPTYVFTSMAESLLVEDAKLQMSMRSKESNATVAGVVSTSILKRAEAEALKISREKMVDNKTLGEFVKTFRKSKVVFPYFQYLEQYTKAVGAAPRKWVIVGSNPNDRIRIENKKTGGLGNITEAVTGPDE
ncbi:MAG: hypothetical protein CMO64_04305 [Verrucomicrobiales bacterium]|nr:hypothetical protein [Verrucomicrobiales bacterium]